LNNLARNQISEQKSADFQSQLKSSIFRQTKDQKTSMREVLEEVKSTRGGDHGEMKTQKMKKQKYKISAKKVRQKNFRH